MFRVQKIVTILVVCAGCGHTAMTAGGSAMPHPSTGIADRIPTDSTFVVRVDAEKARGVPVGGAFLLALRHQGLSKLFERQERICGFTLPGAIEEFVFVRAKSGLAVVARTNVEAGDVQGCLRRTAGMDAIGAPGSDANDKNWVSLVLDGLLVVGDRHVVDRLQKSPKQPATALRLPKEGKTLGLARGDVAQDVYLEVALRGDTQSFLIDAMVEVPNAEISYKLAHEWMDLRDRAFDAAKSDLARTVLGSVRIRSNGRNIIVQFGVEGTVESQTKYLDVVLSLVLEFVRAQNETGDKPAALPSPLAPRQ